MDNKDIDYLVVLKYEKEKLEELKELENYKVPKVKEKYLNTLETNTNNRLKKLIPLYIGTGVFDLELLWITLRSLSNIQSFNDENIIVFIGCLMGLGIINIPLFKMIEEDIDRINNSKKFNKKLIKE